VSIESTYATLELPISRLTYLLQFSRYWRI